VGKSTTEQEKRHLAEFHRTLDTHVRVVSFELVGEIDDDELRRLHDQLDHDPEVMSGFSIVIDLRPATGPTVSSDSVATLANQPVPFNSDARLAVIAAEDLGFGLARLYEMQRGAQSGRVKVFRDPDAAKRWAATGAE
jgi:hypothetical protein